MEIEDVFLSYKPRALPPSYFTVLQSHRHEQVFQFNFSVKITLGNETKLSSETSNPLVWKKKLREKLTNDYFVRNVHPYCQKFSNCLSFSPEIFAVFGVAQAFLTRETVRLKILKPMP